MKNSDHKHDNGSSSRDSTVTTFAFETSFSQQRLWFLNRLLGNSSLYNISKALHLNGKLDISALQQSLNAIVARHEILRTSFSEKNGEPQQLITESIDFQCQQIDLTTFPEHERDAESQSILDTEVNKAFDLKQAPLMRALLLTLSAHQHILLITLHHIISDGWSMQVLNRELINFYQAFTHKQSTPLPELPIQYADYAVWQREWLQGEVLEKQLSYWSTQLDGVSTLELPTNYSRPKQLTYRGTKTTIHIPVQLTQRLEALSQKQGVTLFMTLLAAFQVLLHRYSGQQDIVVGSPIAGRNQQETEHLIGFFVNTLVLRNDLSGQPGFVEFLKRVRKTCIDAYANQDIPFEKLVAELHPQRDMSRHPFFQVALVLQQTAEPDLELSDLTVNKISLANETAKFDLSVSLQKSSGGLKGTIEYSTDLFDSNTITKLVGHFQVLLEGIVNQPETSIAELPLLTKSERHQLLVTWNDTKSDYPKNTCTQHLFEQQCKKTPTANALSFEDKHLSYQDLNSQANQLAYYLQRNDVTAGSLVGICMNRCTDLIIGLLAILKAGAAYVPLDPDYPKQRLTYMLENTQLSVLLTQQTVKNILPDKVPLNIIVVDGTEAFSIQQQPITNLSVNCSASQAAYLIFTSGSTGEPKGALIPHYAINRLVLNSNYIELTHLDRIAQVSNVSFDAATFEIWGALLTGGCLVIIPKAQLLSLTEFGKTLERKGITTLFLTTALLNKLIEISPDSLASLNTLLFGGEAVNPNRIRQLLSHQSPKRLLHVYGPTESTTFATWFEVQTVLDNASTIPIGHPLANTTTYILNQYMQPQPVGVTGELYLGGKGIALGYYHSPELNKQRFVPNPFNQKNDNLYKTGDFVRYLADGNIEFVGRVDHQIKLRGFRIELGEIEAILQQHPAINEALIVVDEDSSNDKHLIAYLRLVHDSITTTKALRDYLEQKLPYYMIPAHFILLDQFPLTANGKVDREALPHVEKTCSKIEQSYIAPRSQTEQMMVEIWQQVLKIERIGIHDNFFESGGHSLLVVVMCAKIEAVFKRAISLDLIFEFPTVSLLSNALEQYDETNNIVINPIITTVKKEGSQPPFFWIQGATIIPTIRQNIDSDRPFYFINHQSRNGKRAQYLTISEIASFYIKAMMKIDSTGPYYLGGYSIGGMIMYEVARQLREQGKTIALLFLLDPTGINIVRADNKGTTIPRLTPSDEYKYLKKVGYITYFRDRINIVKMKLYKEVETKIIQIFLILGIPLPNRLNWPYLLRIYEQAGAHYQPQPISSGIDKAVLVQVNGSKSNKNWISLFNDKVDTYFIKTTHLKLIEKEHSSFWVSILAKELSTGKTSKYQTTTSLKP